ncbi:MAG: hypothetical protein EPO23_13030 [Xanthobacteraceae bacterium]|nr:MAG: hypothetical protein EPO23_13030 [Xanthobacteraceae bacterium]
MRFSDSDLRAASAAGLLDAAQTERLIGFLMARQPAGPDADTVAVSTAAAPTFDFVHILWYAGALIVMGAMGLFSTLAFAQMGGAALAATAVIYATLFAWAGDHLWRAKNLHTPGGLLIAVAASMAPLAVYGLQDAAGWWGQFGKPDTVQDFYVWVKGSFIFMEIAAIAAAALALRFYRFPFIVVIAAVALWFMSMDIVPWITGSAHGNWEISRKASVWFGLGVLVAAVSVNARQRSGDFAFWLYLFGLITFWGGITASSAGSHLDKALYCAMNVVFLFLAVFLGRRAFAVFGTLGIAIYLGDLASKVFKDSLLFPFALSLIGIAIIAAGLYAHRHQGAIENWLGTRLPEGLRRLRPANAGPA